MKKFLRERLPNIHKKFSFLKGVIFGFFRKSYSQFGEDLVLSSFLWEDKIESGFYVDIGAYHPFKYSNTYFFYKKGWRGINIDAKPGSMNIFKKLRRRDINIELGISSTPGKLDFFIFKESAYNTFSRERADNLIASGVEFNKKTEVSLLKLENVLDDNMPQGVSIDFFSIDAEGLDLDILISNNWNKYKPRYILVEIHDIDFCNIYNNDICKFLLSIGYKIVSIAFITYIFKYEKD